MLWEAKEITTVCCRLREREKEPPRSRPRPAPHRSLHVLASLTPSSTSLPPLAHPGISLSKLTVVLSPMLATFSRLDPTRSAV